MGNLSLGYQRTSFAGLSLLVLLCASSVRAENDFDFDGIPDESDNCASISNTDQADLDSDGVGMHATLPTLWIPILMAPRTP